jgi:hypothetical protein
MNEFISVLIERQNEKYKIKFWHNNKIQMKMGCQRIPFFMKIIEISQIADIFH